MNPLDDPRLTEAYARLSPADAGYHRMQIEIAALDAWQARPDGDTRTLQDFQRDEVDAQLHRNAEARARNAVARARILAGPVAVTGPADSDDPASLAAAGLHFAAAARRRELAEAEHRSRRNRVEAQVASDDSLFQRYRDQFGPAAAERMMSGDYGAAGAA